MMLEPSVSNGDLNHSVSSPEDDPYYNNQSLESIRIDEEQEESIIRHNALEQQREDDTRINDDLDSGTTPLQPFQLGDHVYKWCSFAGIPGVFQHHGIVTEIDGDSLVIADFNNIIRGYRELGRKSLVFQQQKGSMQICERESAHKWRKVEYKASWWRRSLWRSGTCTAVASDPPGLVLSRVAFLLDHADEKLPDYHFLKANCECVAVWCKTGAWATLQASTFLHAYAAGQAKSAATLAMYATSQQVTVPATGLWGFLGFTTKASLLSTQPYLLPAIAGYGLVTVGGPVWILARCKKAWTQTTDQLNNDFWENAIDKPEIFAKCITEWSQLPSS
jgi:hypothetical protein